MSCPVFSFSIFFQEKQFTFSLDFLRILLAVFSARTPVIASMGTCVTKFISVHVFVLCVHAKPGLEIVQI